MKKLIIIVVLFSSISVFGQAGSFDAIPKDLLKQLDKMGVDNSPLLNNYESACLNIIFKDSLKGFDFANKRVGFIAGGQRGKFYYFDMQKKHFVDAKQPCDNGQLYLFNAAQKAECGGYDAAILYWSKFLFPVEKVVKRVKAIQP